MVLLDDDGGLVWYGDVRMSPTPTTIIIITNNQSITQIKITPTTIHKPDPNTKKSPWWTYGGDFGLVHIEVWWQVKGLWDRVQVCQRSYRNPHSNPLFPTTHNIFNIHPQLALFRHTHHGPILFPIMAMSLENEWCGILYSTPQIGSKLIVTITSQEWKKLKSNFRCGSNINVWPALTRLLFSPFNNTNTVVANILFATVLKRMCYCVKMFFAFPATKIFEIFEKWNSPHISQKSSSTSSLAHHPKKNPL